MAYAHRPCLWLALACALGITMARVLAWPFIIWMGAAIVLFVGFLRFKKSVFILALFVCLGGIGLTQQGLLSSDNIAFFPSEQKSKVLVLEGTIVTSVLYKQRMNRWGREFYVHVDGMVDDYGARWRGGKIKVYLRGYYDAPLAYGQKVRLTGKLRPIYEKEGEGFSYRRYLHERGVFWEMSINKEDGVDVLTERGGNPMYRYALKCKSVIIDQFKKYLTPREEAFVSALVIGERTDLADDIKEVFITTGTAHILAISGMNMAVLGTLILFVWALLPFPRPWKYILTIAGLMAYAFISGWSPSVVRASFMGAVVLAGYAFEQQGDVLNSWGLAALILLMLSPILLFDIGFQLSFAAVLGILLLSQPIKQKLACLPQGVKESIAVSVSAFIFTAPLMVFHFQIFTPIAILANIPIVPLADLVMVLGLGLALTGSWCPLLATAFAACLKAVLSAMIILATWFSQWPLAWYKF